MKKFFLWFDIAFYVAVLLLTCIVGWIAILSLRITNFYAVFVVWCLCFGSCLFYLSLRLEKYYASSTYTTRQGVEVWTEIKDYNQVIPTVVQVEQVLDDFAFLVPITLLQSRDLEAAELSILHTQIVEMYKDVKIMFTKRKIFCVAFGFAIKEYNCAQHKNKIIIRHAPSFDAQQLSHALFHLIDEAILHRSPDRCHTNAPWWRAAMLVQTQLDACMLARQGEVTNTKKIIKNS